jgi:phosphotransferase system enzyme I (PtsI)
MISRGASLNAASSSSSMWTFTNGASSADVLREQRRYDRAVKEVRDELARLAENVRHGPSAELAPFVNVHMLLLDDAAFKDAPREIIREQRANAEWALRTQLDELTAQFADIEDPYLREREDDVRQVAERILGALAGTQRRITKPIREDASILVARDLSPADVILFREHPFAAFVTDLGGATSHTAIVARSMNIPAIVALHHARALIHEDELIIVDGTQGVVIVNPDRHVLAEYRLKQNEARLERDKLKRLRSAPAATLDGTMVQLYANIELPSDLDTVKASGATGIGLFRSEFLFMNRPELPDEDEQYEAYREVVEGMKGMPVTIRTLDIGADKPLDAAESHAPVNPALGLRAIRYCLAEPQVFNTQLRAILRASRHGKALILIPMLTTWNEVVQALAAVAQAKEQLRDEGIKFDDYVPVGGMIEVPAAAIALPMFIRKLDFLSVGTNDLIQYTLAIDRADDRVAHLYDPLHPAVLNLLAGVIRTAQQYEKPVAVCGEMAGDAELTRLLLGFGLRHFSMHPAHLLTVKQRVLVTSLPDIAPTVARILKADEPDKMQALIEKLNA